jgi:anti-sigma regulatory factor (Ser/Thr protein kinase)
MRFEAGSQSAVIVARDRTRKIARFMNTHHSFSFELRNHLSELTTLGEKLESVGSTLGLPRRCLFEINLALDELFTNIISYGFLDQSEHVIRVSISADCDVLTVVIEDDGIAFNPIDRIPPELPCSLDECKVGGLGIHLVKNLMDEVAYQRRANTNVLTLKKNIEKT